MQMLITLLEARSGQFLASSALGSAARLPSRTTARYLGLVEEVFLIERVPAWSRNLRTATGTPKVAVVDSGIAAKPAGCRRRPAPGARGTSRWPDRGLVLMGPARQLTWFDQQAALVHYRTGDQVEVDAVPPLR